MASEKSVNFDKTDQHISLLNILFEPIPRVGGKGPLVRNRIANAALALFSSHGYEGASTRAIADLADVKHSLLLYHFETKANLWSFVVAHLLDLHHAAMAENLPDDPLEAPETALRASIEALVDFSARFPQFHRIVILSSAMKELEPQRDFVLELIRGCQKNGKVGPVDPLRLYASIVGACAMMFSAPALIYHPSAGLPPGADEVAKTKDFIISLIFSGSLKPRIRVRADQTFGTVPSA